MFRGIIQTVYLAAGFLVAYQNLYLGVTDWRSLLSAIGAVLLWPLVMLGVNMHLGAMIG